MSQTLTLPDELYVKLAHGAEQRGLTIEALLAFISEAVATPDQASERDLARNRRMERLLAKYQAGPLTHEDRVELESLIDGDYRAAVARADRIIAARKKRRVGGPSTHRPTRDSGSSRKVGKRSRT
jgi:hypothetical protein